jgi:hypothetical protein
MSIETITVADAPRATPKLRIDFLFLDLTTCTRCRGTDRSLGAALTVVADVLQAAGIKVEVNKVHVASEEQARAWRFVSSPTIRVNGADIALELRESSCGSEACTDGCGDQIACRVWLHHGREYTEPPAEMIVDAILRHVYDTSAEPTESQARRYELPENLRRFFAGKAEPAENAQSGTAQTEPTETEPTETGCCPVSEQQTCCNASAKEDCCGSSVEQRCGCR